MTLWTWSGDLEGFLAAMPAPLFRQRDAFDVCDRFRISRVSGNSAWHRLVLEGRIVRTNIPIGRSTSRCYWTRSYCSIRLTEENRRLVYAMRPPLSASPADRRYILGH